MDSSIRNLDANFLEFQKYNQLFVESQTPLRSVIISDVSGRINSNIKVNGTTAVTIDLNLMSNGVYFLRAVCSDGKIKTTKFLKR